jgi:hypothetical protein
MRATMIAVALTFTFAAPCFAESCRKTAGAKKSAQFVRHCLAASPATRPPCNAGNECELILDEIRRGCGLFSRAEKPKFCASYE